MSEGDSGLEGTLDKTWQEIHDALQNKICLVVVSDNEKAAQYLIESASIEKKVYHVLFGGNDFSTTIASGYPAHQGQIS